MPTQCFAKFSKHWQNIYHIFAWVESFINGVGVLQKVTESYIHNDSNSPPHFVNKSRLKPLVDTTSHLEPDHGQDVKKKPEIILIKDFILI